MLVETNMAVSSQVESFDIIYFQDLPTLFLPNALPLPPFRRNDLGSGT